MSADKERAVVRKDGFGEKAVERRAETSSSATAAQAEALVKAQYTAAMMRPRNVEDSRVRILDACRRPAFAEKARYAKPVGGQKIRGLSVRFADEAAKLFGNIRTSQSTTYDDDEQRIVEVTATDLETNLAKSQTVVIKKTIERRKPKDGQEVIGKRENSSGDTVYILRATDDEVFNKEANLCAKARRNLELQLIPGDILEEAEQTCIETSSNADAADPRAAVRKVIDSFSKYNIRPTELEKKLGHSVDNISPSELQELREIYTAISSGETSWYEIMSLTDTDAYASDGENDPLKPGRHERKPRRSSKPATEPELTPTPALEIRPEEQPEEESEEPPFEPDPAACKDHAKLVEVYTRSPDLVKKAIELAAKGHVECERLREFSDIDHTDPMQCALVMAALDRVKRGSSK